MRDFFHGWRRKAGGVSLVMALLLMCGWLRSYSKIDLISFPTGQLTEDSLISGDASLVWERSRFKDLSLVPEFPSWIARCCPQGIYGDEMGINWRWRFAGFGAGDALNDTSWSTLWMTPYWCSTIPLIILSAYLILWKPRKRATKPGSVTKISNSDTTPPRDSGFPTGQISPR